ncbi:unnamed protein product [Didymodactylos carnosus]|uniref:Helix-turn-helix domain-containing protein n=1 Tax=Didymodactylos carnosus TaxID=1234261 RepID=A0A8S2N6Q8_9BILA|nr:unnamed protein product [Didymodactylos carnosus]CAF3977310.1 unnamed protein product [Didymodactylos carnosus]
MMAPTYGYTVVTPDIKDEDLKNEGVHLNDTGVLKLVQTIKETFSRYSRVDATNKTPSQEYEGRFPSNNVLRLIALHTEKEQEIIRVLPDGVRQMVENEPEENLEDRSYRGVIRKYIYARFLRDYYKVISEYLETYIDDRTDVKRLPSSVHKYVAPLYSMTNLEAGKIRYERAAKQADEGRNESEKRLIALIQISEGMTTEKCTAIMNQIEQWALAQGKTVLIKELKEEINHIILFQMKKEHNLIFTEYRDKMENDLTVDKHFIEREWNTLIALKGTQLQYITQVKKLETRARMHEPPPSLNVIDIKLQTKIEKGDPEMLVIQKDWDMSILQAGACHSHHSMYGLLPQATNTAISLTSSQKMILRNGPKQTDKSKVLNIDLPQNYEKKSDIYMARTDAYIEINEHPLKRMIESTNLLLTDLLSKKRISKTVYEKLKPPQDCELPHLYYNPKDHKPGAPLRPIVAQIKSPVARISHFLDKTLRPIFEQHTAHYTLQNTDAFLNHLERYPMTEDTILATFDVTDFYTMIPQKQSVSAVCRLLAARRKFKIGNISIDTFAKLIRHVLDNSYFAYGEKLFKQIQGGAMGSAVTQVLADVYMYEWEKDFLAQQTAEDQLYLRFRDDIFITSRLRTEKLEERLKFYNEKDPHIKLAYEIGKTANYLDVTISVRCPTARTIVYRKPAAQPYVLPYDSAHPRHIKKNISYAAYIRAIRICSDIADLGRRLDEHRKQLEDLAHRVHPTWRDITLIMCIVVVALILAYVIVKFALTSKFKKLIVLRKMMSAHQPTPQIPPVYSIPVEHYEQFRRMEPVRQPEPARQQGQPRQIAP